MKKNNHLFYHNDCQIGSFKSIYSSKNSGYYDIVLFDLYPGTNAKISKYDCMHIEFMFNGYLFYYIELEAFDSFTIKKTKSLTNLRFRVGLDTAINSYYAKNLIKIVNSWESGNKPYKWQDLGPLGKKVWLVACLDTTGIQSGLLDKKLIVLDGLLIKSEVDFFCLVGEAFWGYRGYLGQDLDGFEDCLRQISSKIKVKIINYMQLKQSLNRYYKYLDKTFLEIVLDIFQDQEVNIELID